MIRNLLSEKCENKGHFTQKLLQKRLLISTFDCKCTTSSLDGTVTKATTINECLNITCGDIEVGLKISYNNGCKVWLNTKSDSSSRIENLMENAYYLNKTGGQVSFEMKENSNATIAYAQLKHGRKVESGAQIISYNTIIGTT